MANIMIQGTTSSAGKSLTCTALNRIFREDGFRPFPFKSQNMSSKYYETALGEKISTAQALQARAAGLEPVPAMNPILLIPSTDMGSTVVLNGKEYGHMEAREYFAFRKTLKPFLGELYQKLERENDIIVIEGAGSPAEINLTENDIVNMGMAEMADAPVLLVADIDRGGVFASFYGTVMLLEERHRKRIKGLIINKFRGDKELLMPGVEMIENLLSIPVVGIIPFVRLELEDEDSLIDYHKDCHENIQSVEAVERELSRLAALFREHLDMEFIYQISGLKR